jgi:hypothetical protein
MAQAPDPLTVGTITALGAPGVVEEDDEDRVELAGRRSASWTRTAPGAARGGAADGRARLRANLRDDVVRLLLGTLLVAQLADLWTTHVALAGGALMERNPLFRSLFQSLPGVADAVKLGAVGLLALVALWALPLPRSRHALLLAAGISIVAPIANLMLLAGRV